MREPEISQTVERVPLRMLEAALQARMGWVDRAISPFAVAARKRGDGAASAEKPALQAPAVRQLRLAG
jgi:hypothetical protein